jgi:putative spermidine/putrescine transport system substrate-binding protein
MASDDDMGIDNPYQLTQEQFDAAVALLEAQRDEGGAVYWDTYSDQVSGFASGDLVVGTTWQFMANLLQAEGEPVQTTKPSEGTTGWSDTWMIASDAEHPNCMYAWMDHMMSAEANAQATVWFGEAATSQEACDAAEAISPGHCELTHATDEAYWEDVWYWATPREDCGDDDDATTCVDQDGWTEAWNNLRGI